MNIKQRHLTAIRDAKLWVQVKGRINRKIPLEGLPIGDWSHLRREEPTWDMSGFREAFARAGAADIVLSFGPSTDPPSRVMMHVLKRRER
jgi:hypothetical protein